MKYDCVIIGGGISGLQAAIQLGRYMHQVLVIDDEDGRFTLCKEYHNDESTHVLDKGSYLRKSRPRENKRREAKVVRKE